MALPEAALRAFCVVIFETGPRTLTSYNAAWHQEIMQFAAGKYSRELIDKVFVAGRINEEQKNFIFSLMPEPEPEPEESPETEPADSEEETQPTESDNTLSPEPESDSMSSEDTSEDESPETSSDSDR